jgi:hypothetical protein
MLSIVGWCIVGCTPLYNVWEQVHGMLLEYGSEEHTSMYYYVLSHDFNVQHTSFKSSPSNLVPTDMY